MIRFECTCGKRLKVEDSHAGRTVKCGACGAQMTAPASNLAAADDLDAMAQAMQSAAPRPANGSARPGQGKRPPVLPGSKMPFYIGLGVAGGIMLIVLVVAAVTVSGNGDPRPKVRPVPVTNPKPVTTDTSDEPPWGFFRKVKPQN